MAKNKNNKIQDEDKVHYPEIPLTEKCLSNSILTNINFECLSKDEKAKLLDYFVVEPINLKETSRRFYDLKKEKGIDFKNKKLRKTVIEIYPFNDKKFHLLESKEETNLMCEWFENGKFPNDEQIEEEKICIKNTYGSSKLVSLIKFVRNCICHGNFEVVIIHKAKYIVLEDNNRNIIRGRGTILLKTLFKLVEAIKNFDQSSVDE